MKKEFPWLAMNDDAKTIHFVHFLSFDNYLHFRNKNCRRSRNDDTKAGARVPGLLASLKLSHLTDKSFLSMYVITKFTASRSSRNANSYSEESGCAIELPISELNGREVYVFNGDVQNLAAPGARTAHCEKFEGENDTSRLLSKISEWCDELPDQRDRYTFVCEARLIGGLTSEMESILYGCPDPMCGTNNGDILLAVEALTEDEEEG